MAAFHLMDQNPEKRVYRERHREGDRDREMGRRKPVNHETQRKRIKGRQLKIYSRSFLEVTCPWLLCKHPCTQI